jgi:hypothetical protein
MLLFSLKIIISHVIKKTLYVGHWWLTPVILATEEVDIRRITV